MSFGGRCLAKGEGQVGGSFGSRAIKICTVKGAPDLWKELRKTCLGFLVTVTEGAPYHQRSSPPNGKGKGISLEVLAVTEGGVPCDHGRVHAV